MRATFEVIFSYVMFAVGSALLLYVVFARRLRIHRAHQWVGGYEITRCGEWAIALFVFGIGAAALTATHKWIHQGVAALAISLALGAWVVGFVSQQRSRRRHIAQLNLRRSENAALHPEIFDRPAPTDLAGTPAELLDLYDLRTYAYLGSASKRDILFLLNRYECLAENENDLFVLAECIDPLPQDAISPELRKLLHDALERDGELTLRWVRRQKG